MTLPPFKHFRPVEKDHHTLGGIQCRRWIGMTETTKLTWLKKTYWFQKISQTNKKNPKRKKGWSIDSQVSNYPNLSRGRNGVCYPQLLLFRRVMLFKPEFTTFKNFQWNKILNVKAVLINYDCYTGTWSQSSTCRLTRVRKDLKRNNHARIDKSNGVIHWNDSCGTISNDWLSQGSGIVLRDRSSNTLEKMEAMAQFFFQELVGRWCVLRNREHMVWQLFCDYLLWLSLETVVLIDETRGRQTWKAKVRRSKPQKKTTVRVSENLKGTYWSNFFAREGFKSFMPLAKGRAMFKSWLTSRTLRL